MLDHQNFHATYHFGCVSCEDIIRVITNFNFFTLDKVKKELGNPDFDNPKLQTKLTEEFFLMWKEKVDSYLKGEDSDNDFWCINCHILYWSYNDLRDHILKQHSVSKIFEHNTKTIIDRLKHYLHELQTQSVTSVQEFLFLSKSCTYTWSPSIMVNPLIVVYVVKYLRGKTTYIDIIMQGMEERILKANSSAMIVTNSLADKEH